MLFYQYVSACNFAKKNLIAAVGIDEFGFVKTDFIPPIDNVFDSDKDFVTSHRLNNYISGKIQYEKMVKIFNFVNFHD